MADKLYFAYGSNINLRQMAHRCPDAQVVGPVRLEGYELLFRGAAREYGVATIAPKEGGVVHGLLWKLPPESEQALDMYEGYPRLYDKKLVTARDTEGRALSVMAYVITHLPQRAPALPSPYYYNGIQEGYQASGLPLDRLTEAWEHCAREIRQRLKRRNHAAAKHPKGKEDREGR